VRYLMDPDSFSMRATEMAGPLCVWGAVTLIGCIVIWRMRIQVRVGFFIVYVVLSSAALGLYQRMTAYGEEVNWSSSGVIWGQTGQTAGQWAETVALINSLEFVLECGRHLAPPERLEQLYNCCSRWEFKKRDDDDEYSSWPMYVEARGLTQAEKRVLLRWVTLWRNEADHAVAFRAMECSTALKPNISGSTPLWTTGGAENNTSFDCPPNSRYVRRRMAEMIEENRSVGISSYCERQLKAARALDRKVGLPPYPEPAGAPTPTGVEDDGGSAKGETIRRPAWCRFQRIRTTVLQVRRTPGSKAIQVAEAH
jgi:hypothetical protein